MDQSDQETSRPHITRHWYILRDNVSNSYAGRKLCEQCPADDNRTSLVAALHSEKSLLPVLHVLRENLLPMSRFLLNQPKFDFWALRRARTHEYVTAPSALRNGRTVFGHEPFHFESLGELVFFMELQKMVPADFLVAHYQQLSAFQP